MRCAQSSTRRPSAVSPRKRWPRSTMGTPRSASSWRIAADKVGCETWQLAAARPKCRSRANAARYWSCLMTTSLGLPRSRRKTIGGGVGKERSPRRRLADRHPVDRFDVEFGAVDHRKPAVLPFECKKQVGAAEHHGFSTLRPAELPPGRPERLALRLAEASGDRHPDIGLVDLLERLAL